MSVCNRAVFGVSWPQYARHQWQGAWINSIFRNEGAGLSSELIRQGIAATIAHYGAAPPLGMITFVKAAAIRNGLKSGRQIGRCYIKAGFREIGQTKIHKHRVFQLPPEAMPTAEPAIGVQSKLFAA